MVNFKDYFIHPALESPNILIFYNSIPEAVAEVGLGAAEYMEAEDMVLVVSVEVVSEEDVLEGDIFITHMNLPAGTEHLWQNLVYTLHTNGLSSPCNKRIIFKK